MWFSKTMGFDRKDETPAAEIQAVNGEWVVMMTGAHRAVCEGQQKWNKVPQSQLDAPCLDFLSGHGGTLDLSSTLPTRQFQ